jgi:hypothetical protein
MKKLTLVGLIFAAFTNITFAKGMQGSAALAPEQPTQESWQVKKVKRDASGRMQLEPLKASDFTRRASPPKVEAPAPVQPTQESWQGKKVKRSASGRMQLEPMKASDFTRRNEGSK